MVLGGRYRLIELLGQGGMARIYRGHDNQLDREVAVKLLRPEYGRDPDFGSRFRQEAQSAASLNHQNIVAVHDYGQDEAGPFIVMELVDGEDLATIVKRSGALPPRQAARIVGEAARALQVAHGRGIVHRDVKPGNLLISRDGRVKVTDFGIARAVAEAQMTLPGTTLGSVHYFSPEQARGEQATAASDIYALGIVLYELLTGRRPWEADSAAAVAMARLAGPVPDPAAVRAGIPPDLAAIARRAMALEPADRWASATALAAALDAFLAGQPVPEAGPIVGSGTGPSGGPAVSPGAAGALGGAAGAALGGTASTPTSISATARPNPAAVPYAPDAYARGRQLDADEADDERRPARDGRPARRAEPVEDEERSSPLVWVAGLVALAILVATGLLVFNLLNGGRPPEPGTITVPNFVGLTYEEAQDEADRLGLVVSAAAFSPSTTQEPDTVLAQDPPPGTELRDGGEVRLTLAQAEETVAVPTLRGLTLEQAIQTLIEAGLTPGTRTDVFDPIIPAGQVVRQDPLPGIRANPGTPVNYDLSTGPEPTPSPSPTPTPTPEPTAPPTAPPTPTPEPTPIEVGNYVCLSVADARNAITADGFAVDVVGSPPEDWLVNNQDPDAGTMRPPGETIRIEAAETVVCV